MADFTADFEAGVDGNTITTGAGEASATKFDFVVGSPVYDDTHVAHGSLAMKSISGGASCVEWTASGSEHYGRLYCWFPAFPTTNWFIAYFTGVFISAGTGDGRLQLRTAGDTDTFTTAIATGQWIRLEWHVIVNASTGVKELKLFNNAASTTPTETIGSTNIDTGTYGQARLGANGGSIGVDFWLDDIVANATSYPGPFVDPNAVFNLAPVIYGRGAC
jgi:hypothetical protein